MPEFDEAQKWVANNGFAVVIAILLLLLLRYVIIDAVAHFNRRLDTMSSEQLASFRDMTSAIRHLDETLDRLADQSAANHEAINTVLLFISHTQQEVVAHRTVVEGLERAAPSPPMNPS
jgi:hypothetical protein